MVVVKKFLVCENVWVSTANEAWEVSDCPSFMCYAIFEAYGDLFELTSYYSRSFDGVSK